MRAEKVNTGKTDLQLKNKIRFSWLSNNKQTLEKIKVMLLNVSQFESDI